MGQYGYILVDHTKEDITIYDNDLQYDYLRGEKVMELFSKLKKHKIPMSKLLNSTDYRYRVYGDNGI